MSTVLNEIDLKKDDAEQDQQQENPKPESVNSVLSNRDNISNLIDDIEALSKYLNLMIGYFSYYIWKKIRI